MLSLNVIASFTFIFTLHGKWIHSESIAPAASHVQQQYARNNVTSLCGNTKIVCDCGTENPGVQITCRHKYFTNELFLVNQLPNETEILILSNNEFQYPPALSATKLRILDLSQNRLITIKNTSFSHLTTLIELNMASNRISIIENEAFNGLSQLKRLDLAHNELKKLNGNVFRPLAGLEALILSKNAYLNETLQANGVDLFSTLGVSNKLARLELNDVGISSINLANGTGIKELYLKYNRFTKAPANLPVDIELIDFMGNRFVELDQNFLPAQNKLRELHMYGVQTLAYVGPHAFHNLTSLRVLDLNECRNLKTFDRNAFSRLPSSKPTNQSTFVAHFLERINIRRAQLTRFSLEDSLEYLKLDRMDLYGNPLICDCELQWLKNYPIETHAICAQPDELSGRSISGIPKRRLICRSWPNFVYVAFHSVMVVGVLFIGAIPIWLLILVLKPSRRKRLQKIGSSSPYRPITIETNLAEDYYL